MKRKLIHFAILFAVIGGVLSYLYFKTTFFQKPVKIPEAPETTTVTIKKSSFAKLPGWNEVDLKNSLKTFQISCKTFLRQSPDKYVGSEYFSLHAKDWQPICQASLGLNNLSTQEIRNFFQKWFVPVEFYKKLPVKGLFTGYYMPLLKGSLIKTKQYSVPLYSNPDNLISLNLKQFRDNLPNKTLFGRVKDKRFIPYYTRAEINQGALEKHAKILAWLDNPIDRIFLEIQGSGIIQLPDGKQVTVSYSGENGAPYTSIAKVLIDQGIMTKDNASMQHIRKYLTAHPDQMHNVLNKNKSFVFFEIIKKPVAMGSQGVELTPGYSLAIDRKWVPLGVPVWLNTTRPDENSDKHKKFRRLMIAQDTGGAIQGVVRGDVYWGAGEKATSIAGRMKNPGRYWLLLPKHVVQ